MSIENIIVKPIITEKSTILESNGKYVFRVSKSSNKIEIRKALEKIFNTKVIDVNIVNLKPKSKRRGRVIGSVSGFKKAIVTLKKGEKIKIREEKKEKKEKPVKKEAKEDKKEEQSKDRS